MNKIEFMQAVVDEIRARLLVVLRATEAPRARRQLRENVKRDRINRERLRDDDKYRIAGLGPMNDNDVLGNFELVDSSFVLTYVIVLFKWRFTGDQLWAVMLDLTACVVSLRDPDVQLDASLVVTMALYVVGTLEEEFQGDWVEAATSRGAVRNVAGISFLEV